RRRRARRRRPGTRGALAHRCRRRRPRGRPRRRTHGRAPRRRVRGPPRAPAPPVRPPRRGALPGRPARHRVASCRARAHPIPSIALPARAPTVGRGAAMTVRILDYRGDGTYYLADPALELNALRAGPVGWVLGGEGGQ